jgi:hypothetical protein
MLKVYESLPNWSLDEMVAHSDAVVVGTVVRKMGTKRSPNGYSADYDYVFKDYELAVEQSVFPSGLPQRIAILTEAGIASNDSNLQVSRAVKGPEFEAGERVMVFLERVRSEVLNETGHSIPEGFTQETYYRVIVSAGYGKLSPTRGVWKDSRSRQEVTISEVEGSRSQ